MERKAHDDHCTDDEDGAEDHEEVGHVDLSGVLDGVAVAAEVDVGGGVVGGGDGVEASSDDDDGQKGSGHEFGVHQIHSEGENVPPIGDWIARDVNKGVPAQDAGARSVSVALVGLLDGGVYLLLILVGISFLVDLCLQRLLLDGYLLLT